MAKSPNSNFPLDLPVQNEQAPIDQDSKPEGKAARDGVAPKMDAAPLATPGNRVVLNNGTVVVTN